MWADLLKGHVLVIPGRGARPLRWMSDALPCRPKCPDCQGHGIVMDRFSRFQRNIPLAMAIDPPDSNDRECPTCDGTGEHGPRVGSRISSRREKL